MMKLRGMVPRNRLLFLRNFIFVLLVLLLFSCFVVSIYQHQIRKMILSDIELLNLSSLEQNIQTLDGAMLDLRELTFTACEGSEMGIFFSSDPQIEPMQKLFDENIEKATERLTFFRSASPYIESIYAYSIRMNRLICSTKWSSEALQRSNSWRTAAEQCDSRGTIRVFFQRWNDRYPYLLTLIRAIPAKNGGIAGYMMVDVNIEKLASLVLGSFPNKENGRLFAVDSSGQMLLSTPYYLLGERSTLPDELQALASGKAGVSQMLRVDGNDYIVSCQDSTQEGWRYILLRPYQQYFSLTARGEWIFSLMLTLVLVMVLLVVALIAFATFHPLNRIITAIEEPAAPPPAQNRSGKGMQEVERIIQSVYDLRLTNSAMQSQLNEKIHEFSLEQVRALQHQMDPHFLYNVLDYFRWVAIDELGEGSALEEMARTLSEYFRIALRRSDYVVPLRDEMHHVELFMRLYAYRYAGRLQVHNDVPPDMLDCRVLKLSIQPIVDNAIKHGLRPRRYMGNIWIGASREPGGVIVVTVENDGERMAEDALERINSQLNHPEASDLDEHIGLSNIARRIHLIFGTAFGVSLQNTATGVIVRMRLPDCIPTPSDASISPPLPENPGANS